jgi:KUP system potassium uptake protein
MVILATTAAVIASQAMISGSFTLISEAVRLNLWPKVRINYPSVQKETLVCAFYQLVVDGWLYYHRL